jgi:hypothetical protein
MKDSTEVLKDIRAFADSETDVTSEHGVFVYEKGGDTHQCELVPDRDEVQRVIVDGTEMTYSAFLTKDLGRFETLARAILEKNLPVDPYIDTQAVMSSGSGDADKNGLAIDLLRAACEAPRYDQLRLLFITADAGDGKTALLRTLSRSVAQDYLDRKSSWLMLHINMAQRSFTRLEDAIAGDLDRLRVAGLFYSGVLRLAQNDKLVVAIDGCEELLHHISSGEALSGLGGFLRQLGTHGIVLASARTAFFESEGYAAQSQRLTEHPTADVVVDQLRLTSWTKAETVQLFKRFRCRDGRYITDPDGTYDRLSRVLGEPHPALQRPFLVSQMAGVLCSTAGETDRLLSEIKDQPNQVAVVPFVIRAFLRREVEEKWRDQNGRPYLTLEQHEQLLGNIAEEMWYQNKNSLREEDLRTIAELFAEALHLPPNSRVEVCRRVCSHALLPAEPGRPYCRVFDHEEFFNYFLACQVAAYLTSASEKRYVGLLERGLLPDHAALWAAHSRKWSADEVAQIVVAFSSSSSTGLWATYLKPNLGLIAAKIITALQGADGFLMENLVFQGDAWCGSRLRNCVFRKCAFLKLILRDTQWDSCKMQDCEIVELVLDDGARMSGCRIEGNSVVGAVVVRVGDDLLHEYDPAKFGRLLADHGLVYAVSTATTTVQPSEETSVSGELRKALEKFLRVFNRKTAVSEAVLKIKLGSLYSVFDRKLKRPLVRAGIVKPSELAGQTYFRLQFSAEDILRGQSQTASSPESIRAFWHEIAR